MRNILGITMIALLSACGVAATQVASTGQDHLMPVVVRVTAVPVEATEPPAAPAEATEPPAAPAEATEPPSVPAEATEAPATHGDAAHGAVLFTEVRQPVGVACSSCHHADSDERLVGPGLLTVGTRAETRREGLSASDYLHQSIVEPGAFVVGGYFNMMPSSFSTVFSEDEIDDLVVYLLTLRG